MKIGFSAAAFDKGKSGISTYIRELLKAFQALDQQDEFTVWMQPQDAEVLKINHSHFKIKMTPNWLDNPILNVLWHQFQLPLEVLSTKCDVLHIPTIRRIPFFKSCPLVVTIHDLAPFKVDKKYDVLRTIYHKQFLKRLVKRCDRVITVSMQSKKDIVEFTQYPEEKISVIYPGFDRTLYHPGLREEGLKCIRESYSIQKPFFLYVSRLEYPSKNHVRLIEAFNHFKTKEKTDHQLVFVGSEWKDSHQIKEAVSNSPYRADIHLLGFIPTTDVAHFYRACDKMVFPSLFEGLGLPIIEALACGASVACSDIPIFHEIAGDTVDYFDPYSIEDIAESLNRKSPQGSAQEELKKFDWLVNAQQTLQVYRQALRR